MNIDKFIDEFVMLNKKYCDSIRPNKPSTYSTMRSVAYNPKSRDCDGNSVSLKHLRDLMTELGYIKDDSRKYFKELQRDEVLQKEYKIEIYLTIKEL